MEHPPEARRIDGMGYLAMREAAAKYGLPLSTLRHWIQDGLVRVHTRPSKPGLPMLLFESDVAALAKHYTPGAGRGKRQRLKEQLAS